MGAGSANPKDRLVLIVDDDPSMRDVLEFAVVNEGFTVELATDGLEAIKKMRDLKPDVAILDLMLPNYGGLELLYELRRGATASIPLIVVTARYTSPGDKSSILGQPHVTHYFEKPVDSGALAKALHSVLGTSRR